jgi:putative transposase
MAIPSRNSDPANIQSDQRCFFITASTFGKRALLQSERSASLLMNVLAQYQVQTKFRLHAFVVMPDHFHALLSVDSDMSIEKAVQFIKGGFSFRAGRELGMRGEIWQKGFSEVRVLSYEQFEAYKTYIHQNPLRKHLCNQPEEFVYSSANGRLSTDLPPERLKPAASFPPERHG